MVAHLTRQLEIIPTDNLKTHPVCIIGTGAVGGWLGLMLAKMGIEDITAYDFDTVEVENMNNQFFRFSDIGSYKVLALANLVHDFTNVNIKAFNNEFDYKYKAVTFCCVDSMDGRKKIWEGAKSSPICRWYIDSRMGAEYVMVYCVDMYNIKARENYSKTLFSDENAAPVRCTNKATVYTSSIVGGLVTKAYKDIITNSEYRKDVLVFNINENAMESFNV